MSASSSPVASATDPSANASAREIRPSTVSRYRATAGGTSVGAAVASGGDFDSPQWAEVAAVPEGSLGRSGAAAAPAGPAAPMAIEAASGGGLWFPKSPITASIGSGSAADGSPTATSSTGASSLGG
ncbi:hypothetical protein GCM10009000_056940 [Halobacterium noricense]